MLSLRSALLKSMETYTDLSITDFVYWFFHSVNNLTDNSADRSSVKGNCLDTFLSFVYAELRNIFTWKGSGRQ